MRRSPEYAWTLCLTLPLVMKSCAPAADAIGGLGDAVGGAVGARWVDLETMPPGAAAFSRAARLRAGRWIRRPKASMFSFFTNFYTIILRTRGSALLM